jgi:two-component system sensor histidine kinase KdpD
VTSGVILDLLFVAPLFSIAVERPIHLLTIALSVAIAVVVSIIVDQAARRARIAERSAAEAARNASAAETAEAADQVRSALLSAVSHDVRRPLAAAVAAVGGLRATHHLAEADRGELLDTAAESLDALTRLITDLLDVSRAEAGVLAVSLSAVPVDEAVGAALDELSLGPDAAVLDVDDTRVRADAVLLQRVLVNLIANALRYSPVDRPVEIVSRVDDEGCRILVTDHGPGIPPDRRATVFAPFQRAGDRDNASGLGLGLALSNGFVSGMGGSLTLDDTPGGGLTTCVTLPIADGDVS